MRTLHISIEEHPELSSIAPKNRREQSLYESVAFALLRNESNRSNSKKGGVTIEQLDGLLENVEQEFKGLPQRIEEKEKESERVDSLDEEKFTEVEARRLNVPLRDEVKFSPESFNSSEGRKKLIGDFKEKYKAELNRLSKRQIELQSGAASIGVMKGKVEQIKRDLINNRSYFTISVSLFNSGRLNTSIKAPAILRVYIGRGNYVDLKLTLKDFETRSEVSANSTKVAVFDSPEISHLPEDYRKLIHTYWGQSVACVLFIEDVHGSIYNSNAIAFSEGLYQKIIYDRLASAAAIYNPYDSDYA